ncbi:MAG: type II CAAX prenyl endopeptidase Rce1 family protein [Acidobacteriota bacterium]
MIVAALLALAPYLTAAFLPHRLAAWLGAMPAWAQLAAPCLLCIPYALVTLSAGDFAWGWLLLYALLPVAMAGLVAGASDLTRAGKHGHLRWWTLLAVLVVLGLSVDLRWFERAWPAHLSIFNKVLLLDAGIYAFVVLRPLPGTGFDLRLRVRDVLIGLREFLVYLPIALTLGLSLGFLHLHSFGGTPGPILARWAEAWIFTFFFIAVPEELFFRGWLQNLLEERIGQRWALAVTAILFGLAHFNKRTVNFNWRYVLLAAIAGVFYGRAWRQNRRVAASAVTHATVDSVWSLWLR